MATKRRARLRRLLWVAAILATIIIVYVISYLPRRSGGGYRLTQTGEIRYAGSGLSVSDLEQWSPDGCWWQPNFVNVAGGTSSRGDGLGYFFSPLIALDRKLNFPDRILFTLDDLNRDDDVSETNLIEMTTFQKPTKQKTRQINRLPAWTRNLNERYNLEHEIGARPRQAVTALGRGNMR